MITGFCLKWLLVRQDALEYIRATAGTVLEACTFPVPIPKVYFLLDQYPRRRASPTAYVSDYLIPMCCEASMCFEVSILLGSGGGALLSWGSN